MFQQRAGAPLGSPLFAFTAAVLLLLTPPAVAEIVDDFDELETATPGTTKVPEKTLPPIDDPIGTSPEKSPKGNKAGGKSGKATSPSSGKKPNKAKPAGAKPGKKPAVRVVKTAPEAKDKTDRNSPITYKADKVLTFKTHKDYSVLDLVKNVFIRQGRLTLSSQRAKVYLRPAKGQANAIDSITIDGNVQVQKSSRVPAERVAARGDRAVFKNSKRTVVLTGNAVVVKGEQVVRGDRIRYDLKSGNITISGAKGTLKPGGLN